MSRSKHRQHGCAPQQRNAYQWNPPPLSPDAKTEFDHTQDVASATECTGLSQQPVLNESESVDLSKLYVIHEIKPQGNIGKDNPNNDPSEINFHRS